MSKIAIVQMVCHNVNVPRVLCDHMLNEGHTSRHRMAVGALVMVCGVMIAKCTSHAAYEALEVSGDLLGYLIHGIGAVPFVDHLIQSVRENSVQLE